MIATHETNGSHFIILPDGRLERADGRIPADVPIDLIVFPRVSTNLVIQARYENFRIEGYGHNSGKFVAYRGEIALINAESVHVFALAIQGMEAAEVDAVIALKYEDFKRYRSMRCDGQSHKMAEMLATRSFPGVRTDAIFNEGKFSGQSNSGCQAKETWLRRDAEKKGFSTNGMWYCSGLGEYPGDPRAWVGGRGDVEKQARERNLTVDGYVNHKGHAVEPKADIPIAHDIVEAETRDIMDAMPGSKYEDVYERVSDVRTGKVDLNPLRVSEPNMGLDWA